MENNFWEMLESQINETGIVIDRPKGSCHPRYPDFVYQIDYGYISGTISSDKEGIDVFIGTNNPKHIVGILCCYDNLKKDSEIKVLYGCNEEEIKKSISMTSNINMSSIYIPRSENHDEK